MSLHEIATLNKELQKSVKKFRHITEQALQDVRPDVLEEISLSLKSILVISESERKKIIDMVIKDEITPLHK